MPERDHDDGFAEREADRAAAEAAAIGGRVDSDPHPAEGALDESERPLAEAGQGESEGFEAAERQLAERASHGDQHAARRAVEDAPDGSEDDLAANGGEADREYSSELDDDR